MRALSRRRLFSLAAAAPVAAVAGPAVLASAPRPMVFGTVIGADFGREPATVVWLRNHGTLNGTWRIAGRVTAPPFDWGDHGWNDRPIERFVDSDAAAMRGGGDTVRASAGVDDLEICATDRNVCQDLTDRVAGAEWGEPIHSEGYGGSRVQGSEQSVRNPGEVVRDHG